MSRSSETKSAIAQAGRQLLAQGGLSALNMSAVSSESGLARATIYNHLRDRSELLDLVVSELVLELLAVAQKQQESGQMLCDCANWLATDAALTGLRTHSPAELLKAMQVAVSPSEETLAQIAEILSIRGLSAELTSVQSVLRWLVSFAIAPGKAEDRRAGAELLAASLKLESRI